MKQSKEQSSSSTKVRVQFDFSRESLEKLDEIVETLNASTRAEAIRQALTLFTGVLSAQQRGAKLYFHEADGTQKEIMLLI